MRPLHVPIGIVCSSKQGVVHSFVFVCAKCGRYPRSNGSLTHKQVWVGPSVRKKKGEGTTRRGKRDFGRCLLSLWIIIITRHQTGGDVAVRSFSLGIRCIIVTLWPRFCPFLTETCRASSRYKKKPSINAKMTFPRTQNTLPEARAHFKHTVNGSWRDSQMSVAQTLSTQFLVEVILPEGSHHPRLLPYTIETFLATLPGP